PAPRGSAAYGGGVGGVPHARWAGSIFPAGGGLSPNPPIPAGALAPRHTISRSDFCGPQLRSLRVRAFRSSAPDHDLAHLSTNSLRVNRRIRSKLLARDDPPAGCTRDRRLAGYRRRYRAGAGAPRVGRGVHVPLAEATS